MGLALTQLHFLPNFPPFVEKSPIYNLRQEAGKPALFAYRILRTNIVINFEVRSTSDYGLTATLHDLPIGLMISKSVVDLWGVPQDPSHDLERFAQGGGILKAGCPASIRRKRC